MIKYGSLTNIMIGDIAPAIPEVGMGCTELMWTDRKPCTVVWVSDTGKTFKFTYDWYRRTDKNGASEDQTYEYTSRMDAPTSTARRCRDGKYKCNGRIIVVGEREAYTDPHF